MLLESVSCPAAPLPRCKRSHPMTTPFPRQFIPPQETRQDSEAQPVFTGKTIINVQEENALKRSTSLVLPGILLVALALASGLLAGCGSGESFTPAPPASGVTVTGRAFVPQGTGRGLHATQGASLTPKSSRAVSTDQTLPGATASLYSLSTGFPTASSTPLQTTTTDSNGVYTFTGLTVGTSYIILISKTVTDPTTGQPKTVLLSTFVKPATTTVTADADLSTTVAVNYLIAQFAGRAGLGSIDLGAVFAQFESAFDSARNNGTAPTIDLTKSPLDSTSFASAIQALVAAINTSGAFLNNGSVTRSAGFVDFLYDKGANQVNLVIFVLDSAGAYFDADYATATVDSKGNFSATTADNLYTVSGTVLGNAAIGSWSAVNTTDGSGIWSAGIPTATNAYQATGYIGTYTRAKSTVPGNQGKWFVFVNADGTTLMFARDESKQRRHLLKTAVFAGTINASGTVNGSMVFPVAVGTVAGSDALAGGTTTGSNLGTPGSVANHTVTDHSSSVTGSVNGATITGTWQATGLKDDTVFDDSGTFTGSKF